VTTSFLNFSIGYNFWAEYFRYKSFIISLNLSGWIESSKNSTIYYELTSIPSFAIERGVEESNIPLYWKTYGAGQIEDSRSVLIKQWFASISKNILPELMRTFLKRHLRRFGRQLHPAQ
jgi:hypothetical protein